MNPDINVSINIFSCTMVRCAFLSCFIQWETERRILKDNLKSRIQGWEDFAEQNKRRKRDLTWTVKRKDGFCKGVMRLCRVPSHIVCSQASGSRCSPSCGVLSKQISPSELNPEGYICPYPHTHTYTQACAHTHFDPVRRSEASTYHACFAVQGMW